MRNKWSVHFTHSMREPHQVDNTIGVFASPRKAIMPSLLLVSSEIQDFQEWSNLDFPKWKASRPYNCAYSITVLQAISFATLHVPQRWCLNSSTSYHCNTTLTILWQTNVNDATSGMTSLIWPQVCRPLSFDSTWFITTSYRITLT